MTEAAVAELVARGDPDRWRTAMAAPPAARPGLMALYAFNLEIARAPWVASEPIARRDPPALVAGRDRRDLRGQRRRGGTRSSSRWRPTIAAGDLPRRLFEEMIAARLPTPRRRRSPTAPRVDLYIDHTAGHLMELAARHLGAEGAALPVVRDFARGAGTAALLRALPELRARGRDPLPADAAVGALARDGLAAIARARARRGRVPRAAAPRSSPAGRRGGCFAAPPPIPPPPSGPAGSRSRRRWRGPACSGAGSAGAGDAAGLHPDKGRSCANSKEAR